MYWSETRQKWAYLIVSHLTKNQSALCFVNLICCLKFSFIWLWCQCFCFYHAQSGWLLKFWFGWLIFFYASLTSTYVSFQLVLFLTPSFISLIQLASLQIRVCCFSKIIDALKWGCQTTRGSFWDILCGSWIWMTCFIIDDVTFRRGSVEQCDCG